MIVVFDFEGKRLDGEEIEEITIGASMEWRTFLDRWESPRRLRVEILRLFEEINDRACITHEDETKTHQHALKFSAPGQELNQMMPLYDVDRCLHD